jgi:hypothetical protein
MFENSSCQTFRMSNGGHELKGIYKIEDAVPNGTTGYYLGHHRREKIRQKFPTSREAPGVRPDLLADQNVRWTASSQSRLRAQAADAGNAIAVAGSPPWRRRFWAVRYFVANFRGRSARDGEGRPTSSKSRSYRPWRSEPEIRCCCPPCSGQAICEVPEGSERAFEPCPTSRHKPDNNLLSAWVRSSWCREALLRRQPSIATSPEAQRWGR